MEEVPSGVDKAKTGCALQCARIFAIRRPYEGSVAVAIAADSI